MDRQQLADFLRTRRARLQPADAGLEAGVRRRTPGLRREEVARLAGMSADYYMRIEQARGPRPSRQVLDALARALRLSDDEHAHLLHLAGEAPAPSGRPPRHVPASIMRLLDRMEDGAGFVLDAASNVLAWNPLAAALIADFSAWPATARNLARHAFLGPYSFCHFTAAQVREFKRECVADLRAAAGRYPDDPEIRGLVAELSARSDEFATLWAAHDVELRRSRTKRIEHPAVGPIEVDAEILWVQGHDQRLVLYTAASGSPSYDSLQLLRVVGVQDLSR